MKLICQTIDCGREAEWKIYEHGTDVHEYENETHACTAHVGELLSVTGVPSGPVHFTVYPVDVHAFMQPIAR